MAEFASEDELKKFAKSEAVYDVELYQLAIEQASRYMVNATDRTYDVAAEVATSRTFIPKPGAHVLKIDDCVEITQVVENGQTLTAGTHFVPYPLNGRLTSGEDSPYYLLHRYDAYWWTDGPKPTVTVTARWGWTAVPTSIKYATLVLAKTYLDARDEKSGLAGIQEGIGAVRGVDAKAVRDAIKTYRTTGTALVA